MLTSEQAFQYRKTLLEEINDLCFHGNGGFTYNDVYSLSIGRRKFHIKRISEYIKKQNEQINKPNTDNQKSDYELFKSRMQGDVFNVKKAR